MKKIILLFVLVSSYTARASLTTVPQFAKADQPITFTFDVSGTALEGYTGEVWLWSWIDQGCSGNCDAPTNVNPATGAQSDALVTRSADDPDVYTITFTPTVFFGKPASEFETLGVLLKGKDWSNGQTRDYSVNISTGIFEVAFTAPTAFPLFVNTGESIQIEASASASADLSLKVNGVEVAATSNTTLLTYSTTAETAGKYTVEITGDNGATTATDAFTFIVRSSTEILPIPDGVIAGINYDASDPTRATLALRAPGKTSVYVTGDFNGWEIEPAYLMKRDGELFWLEITGLAAGKEYAFQYLVDEEIYIADPYADKILDPDDQHIPESTYPDLMAYPEGAVREHWYFNRLSVLQTGQPSYQWQTTAYTKPPKEELVIYELLIRDFFDDGDQNYQNLIDTLSYLKGLGVNAVELMPVMEFNGNNSWGYNPTFMFAPDKFYGTKNQLKAFIDKAHEQGMAVILDIAMNHNDIPAPYALMYFDFNEMKPTSGNPWFNTTPTHPFNVFFDYDHESGYTQDFLDSINHYWLTEYRVDGFRFDLSKGFTQKFSGQDVAAWSNYDASRIALLKRMADEIWSYAPDAYVILEHFGANTEEKELAEYGMLLWGNLNHAYTQSAMGYADGASLDWGYYGTRDWTSPHLITYMESHDEERVMFKNIEYGNSAGDYNIKDVETGLDRIKAASAFFYTIPGPKMLWQFGEVGYDKPINWCTDGTVNTDCRVSPKPVPWNDVDGLDYNHDPDRMELMAMVSELLKLRNTYDVFHTTDVALAEDNLVKQLTLRNTPFTATPASTDEMNVFVAGNFDVERRTFEASFPHAGNWYNYFSPDAAFSVTALPVSMTLEPGEFRIYTDVKLPAPPEELREETVTGVDISSVAKTLIYPNPVTDHITIRNARPGAMIHITNFTGQKLLSRQLNEKKARIDLSTLPAGVYLIRLQHNSLITTTKFIKME